MTLKEAIENVKQVLSRRALWDNERMGLELGIEALERLKELRNAENPYQNLELSKGFNRCRQKIREPLPSETEEEQQ